MARKKTAQKKARRVHRVTLHILPIPAKTWDSKAALHWLGDEGLCMLWAVLRGYESDCGEVRSDFAFIARDVLDMVDAAAHAMRGQTVEFLEARDEGEHASRLLGFMRAVHWSAQAEDVTFRGQDGFEYLTGQLQQLLKRAILREESAA